MVTKSGNYVDKDQMFTFAVLSIESVFFFFFFFWCEHLVELKINILSSDSYTLLRLSTNPVYIFNKSSLEKDFPGQA